ncbi:MAG: hypothetical protein E6540_13595 [Enterococcus sp.]|nr:hypothetical protein [Enterococcus sp.]
MDALYAVKFSGNIVPINWYKTIVNEKGKTQITAINILADVVYWYRPTVERDEQTGYEIGLRKKFKDNLLQRNYQQISEMFKISETVARNNIVFLERLGVIKRIFKNFKVNGQALNNVMFIELNIEKLFELTFTNQEYHGYKNIELSQQNNRLTATKKEDQSYKNEETNTEITTSISSKKTNEGLPYVGNQSIHLSGKREIDEIKNQIGYEVLKLDVNYKRIIDDVVSIIQSIYSDEDAKYKINNSYKTASEVKSAIEKLNQFDIESAIASFNSVEHEIKNYRNYWITILYNCKNTVNSKSFNQFLTDHKRS